MHADYSRNSPLLDLLYKSLCDILFILFGDQRNLIEAIYVTMSLELYLRALWGQQ